MRSSYLGFEYYAIIYVVLKMVNMSRKQTYQNYMSPVVSSEYEKNTQFNIHVNIIYIIYMYNLLK